MQAPARQCRTQLQTKSRPRPSAGNINIPKVPDRVRQNLSHLGQFTSESFENAFVNLAAGCARTQSGNDSTGMRIEVGIAGTDQIRSNAKPRRTRRCVLFQRREVARLRTKWILTLRTNTRVERFTIQQSVKPLNHDSRRKICQCDEFVWSHVTIRIERRRQ